MAHWAVVVVVFRRTVIVVMPMGIVVVRFLVVVMVVAVLLLPRRDERPELGQASGWYHLRSPQSAAWALQPWAITSRETKSA